MNSYSQQMSEVWDGLHARTGQDLYPIVYKMAEIINDMGKDIYYLEQYIKTIKPEDWE